MIITRYSIHACRLAIVALLFVLLAVGTSNAAEPRPNIVLINADDLGINDLGCYGRKDHSTPNLDRLASQGLRFTSAYCAQSICSPSRAALMTGKHPARLHITTYLPGRPDAPTQKLLHPVIKQHLPLEETTIAEALRDAGYDTGIFGKWHLGNSKEFSPDKQGFSTVYAGSANTKPSDTEGSKGEFDLTLAACDFLAKERTTPFFLYLAHNTPHIAYAARPGKAEANKTAWNPVYADVIASMDESVGKLLAKLDELKLTDNTIVIFISDNGGLHVPEGDIKTTPPTHNTPFRAGKGYLYEGGLRVPLIVRWPGKIKPAVVSQSIINTDLMPTFLSLTQVDATKIEFDGKNRGPEILGVTPFTEPQFLFWHFPHYNNQGGRPGYAIRNKELKLIEYYDTGEWELYDLEKDPSEITNLAPQKQDLCKALRAQAFTMRSMLGVQENKPNPDYDQTAADKIYKEFDTSKVPLRATAAETAAEFKVWRERMNAAVAGQKRPAKAKAE